MRGHYRDVGRARLPSALGGLTDFAAASGATLRNGLRAHLALDLADRGGDSLSVYGTSDLALASPPTWVAAAHPELGVGMRDGDTAFRPELDQMLFVCRGIPSLYFRRERARDGVAAAPSAAEPERLARLLRLVFYVGEPVARADRMSHTAKGRRQLAACSEP